MCTLFFAEPIFWEMIGFVSHILPCSTLLSLEGDLQMPMLLTLYLLVPPGKRQHQAFQPNHNLDEL